MAWKNKECQGFLGGKSQDFTKLAALTVNRLFCPLNVTAEEVTKVKEEKTPSDEMVP